LPQHRLRPLEGAAGGGQARPCHGHRRALRRGAGQPDVDFAAAKDHVAATIAAIAPHDSQERFEGLGVQVIRARRALSRHRGAAGDPHPGAPVRPCHRIAPAIPPIPGIDSVPYLTNETIFDLRDPAEHLIVLGGGPIGIEMAQAHRRLGSEVTVIEAARALGRDDPEIGRPVLAGCAPRA
jgi:pyruvate/2-oxoglutarate dehydrogenase complex dihydrolipoamide dehydrogenase (E3) component